MQKLTPMQELDILNQLLRNAVLLGCGSSRATYKLNDKMVVKVVNSGAGKVQNECEIKTYEKYSNTGYLARIYGYGRNVMIMELVTDAKRRYYDDDKRVDALTSFLEDSLQADDGCQSGYNSNGELVLFDYGLDANEERDNVGEIYMLVERHPQGKIKLLEQAKRQVMQSIFQR